MRSQKKCSACGKWSDWEQLATDVCSHCGEVLLTPPARKEGFDADNYEAGGITQLKFFIIKPGDNFLLKIIRKTAWVIHVAFVSIMAFIIWLISFLAG